MRKIWKMRKILIPQAAVLIFIAAFIACSPYVGPLASTEATDRSDKGIQAKEATDQYGETATVKASAGKFHGLEDLAPKLPEVVEVAETTTAEEIVDNDHKLVPRPLQFDNSVRTALAKMKLSPDHIQAWITSHPKTTLKEIETMSPQNQSKVANIATFIRSVNGKIDPKTAWREAAAIVYYCDKYNVSTELAVGVAKTESHFQPNLTSKAGARGVMQVMWKYHGGMLQAKGIAANQEHMYDPERGIEAGILLLSHYIDAYGSVQKALSRYYGKMSNVYVRKVNNNMAMLEKHTSNTGF